jgi:hypothetical protein
MRKWQSYDAPGRPEPSEVLGTLGVISKDGRLLGKMAGNLFGDIYSLNPWGLRKDNLIISFERSRYGVREMADSKFFIWEK